MIHAEPSTPRTRFASIEIRVVGPDSREFSAVSRAGGGRDRDAGVGGEALIHATRVLARAGSRTVGVATYERSGPDLRVLDLALNPVPPYCAADVVRHLLGALEVAALAGGCRSVVMLPAAVLAATALDREGYGVVANGRTGGWIEKRFTP